MKRASRKYTTIKKDNKRRKKNQIKYRRIKFENGDEK